MTDFGSYYPPGCAGPPDDPECPRCGCEYDGYDCAACGYCSRDDDREPSNADMAARWRDYDYYALLNADEPRHVGGGSPSIHANESEGETP